MMNKPYILLCIMATLFLTSCGLRRQASVSDDTVAMTPVGPVFSADSAYQFCER
jgi:hypothetical protein